MNFSPPSIAFERKTRSGLTTLCGSSSWLTQVTAVPALTVKIAGTNWKLWIEISASPTAATCCGACWATRTGGAERQEGRGPDDETAAASGN